MVVLPRLLLVLAAAACAARPARARRLLGAESGGGAGGGASSSLAQLPVRRLVGAAALASPLVLSDAFAPRPVPAAQVSQRMRLGMAEPAAGAMAASRAPPPPQRRPGPFKRLRERWLRRAGTLPPGRHLRPRLAPWFRDLKDLRLKEAGDLHRDYSATLATTGDDVTLKIIDVSNVALREDLRRELDMTMRFGGGDVAKVLGVSWREDSGRPIAAILMEKLDGDFQTQVLDRNMESVSLEVKLDLLEELLRGLSKLSRAGYAHLNISPTNVAVVGKCALVLHQCDVKIAGMGLIRPIDKLTMGDLEKARVNGMYAPPEAWGDSASFATLAPKDLAKLDTWSVGVLAYELFVGGHPVLREGAHAPYEFDPDHDEKFQNFKRSSRQGSREMAELMEKMLSKRAWMRPSVDSALKSVRDILHAKGVYQLPKQWLMPTVQELRLGDQPRRQQRLRLPEHMLPLPRMA